MSRVQLVSGVCALVAGGAALGEAEALAAGALLAAALLAPHTRARAAPRRALHALLDYCTSPAQVAIYLIPVSGCIFSGI